jgi:hypothetical protein
MKARIPAKWYYAVVQTFRGGRQETVSRHAKRRDAEDAAESLAEQHAGIYGEGHTKVVRRRVNP